MRFIAALHRSVALVTGTIFVVSLLLNGCSSDGGGGGSSSVDLATLASISISPTAATVVNGQTRQFTATGSFANGTTADITGQVSWTSADTGVATISSSTGMASGVAVGSTIVIASVNGITSNNAILTVKQLSAIAINPAVSSVAKGLTTKFTAIGTFTDGTTANITSLVTWTIGDSTVATINSATGFATGVMVGATTVTASAGGVVSTSASLTVTANTVSLTGISIAATSLTTPNGTSVTFTATGTYSDSSTGDISGSVVWASTNSSVATMNGTGIASTLAQGDTTISASANGVSSNNVTLTVTAPALTSISVNPAAVSVPKFLTTSFTATGTYTDGTTANITSQVTWASGNPAIATINSSTGVVTGVSLGSTKVRASSGSILSADANLTVTAAVLTGISITPAIKSTPKGSSVTFTATGTYSDGSSTDASGSVIWTSSNTAVATINGSGVLTSRTKGTTTVTASASGLASNSATLTVTDAALTAISINPNSASVAKGLTANFTAIGIYTDATTANISNQVTWAVGNSAVATINSSTGVVIGVTEGESTTVTASVNGITSPGASLYVTAAALTGISISPTTKSTPKGTPVTFTATGTYSDGNSGDVSGSVSWTSSNTAVATMNSTGIASSVAQGSTTVSASASGQTSNPAILTVTAPVLAALSITPPIASITLGNTRQFTASGVLTDGTVATLGAVAWTSSNTAVATVDSTGLVTTHASGSTNISAISDSVTSNTTGLMVSLAASGGISAVATSGQLTISWTAVTGATSYNLYWGTASGLTASYTKIAGVSSPYVLGLLNDGNTYYYRIGAVAADGSETLSAEAYSYLYVGGKPAGTFTPTTQQLAYARVGHNSILLANGKVLVTGGEGTVANTLAYSELYDPATLGFTATGSLRTARAYATDTLLPNGNVLVVGGHNGNGTQYLASAEIYNPALGTFAATGSMATARDTHTATLLANGKVLITGGWSGTAVLDTAEIYDPATGSFTQTGSMLHARHLHTATLLASGKVLVAGGCSTADCLLAGGIAGGDMKTAEIYDPATGTFTATGDLLHTRHNHTATLIAGGKVFIIGGTSFTNASAIAVSETYNPDTGVFSQTATMTDGPNGTGVDSTGYYRSALLLSSGDVLIMPCGCGSSPTGAHLYHTLTDSFDITGSSNGLHNQNSVLLFNGKVLLTGGQSIMNNIGTPSNDAELFN